MVEVTNAEPEAVAIRKRHQALAILRILDDLPGYAAHDELLNDLLNLCALDDSRDQLRDALDRLEAAGLVTKTDAPYGLVVVRLAERGAGALSGCIEVDEVRKPGQAPR